MTTISVPDMMCENCVKRITNALTAADLKFTVSLDTKTVTVDGCDNCVKTRRQRAGGPGLHPGGPLNPLGGKRFPEEVPCLSKQARDLFLRPCLCHHFVTFFIFSPAFCRVRLRISPKKWET